VTHGHNHSHAGEDERRIAGAFFLNLAFTLIEAVGGLLTNSMAVLSDALHDLGDSIALGLAWHFARLSKREGNEVFTFGYRRFSLVGALVMSIVLFAGGGLVLFRAIPRILAPEPSNAEGMLILAGIGIAVNGFAALRMRAGRSLGERIVTWHFVEDILGWLAVLVAGSVMLIADVPVLDPLLSVLITLYVFWNVGKRLRETLRILLQGVPGEISLETVEKSIREISGICDVHHTHIWSQDGEHHVLTGHVVIRNADSYEDVAAVRRRIKEHVKQFGIEHATIEVESQDGPPCVEATDGCGTCREQKR
jgi:cobalt-zinc-cadmium efflux system protein